MNKLSFYSTFLFECLFLYQFKGFKNIFYILKYEWTSICEQVERVVFYFKTIIPEVKPTAFIYLFIYNFCYLPINVGRCISPPPPRRGLSDDSPVSYRTEERRSPVTPSFWPGTTCGRCGWSGVRFEPTWT